ncbi:MAG: family 16 glycoside hydrolase [bacterium]
MKFRIFCLIPAIFIFCRTQSVSSDTLYSCDFSENTGWAGHDNVFTISNGLCSAIGQGDGLIYYFFHSDSFGDFTYSVRLVFADSKNDSDYSGVCYRLTHPTTGYFFNIAPDKWFKLSRISYSDAEQNMVLKTERHSFIRPDTNTIKVSAGGSRLRCYVNDVLVFDTTNTELPGGDIGLVATNMAKVTFDDVLVEDKVEDTPYPEQFADNFNDGDLLNWMRLSQDNDAAIINTGNKLKITGSGKSLFYSYITSGVFGDMELSVNSSLISSGAPPDRVYTYGLIFRSGNGGRYYFLVSKKKYFGLIKYPAGQNPVYLKELDEMDSNIKGTGDILKARCVGDSIKIFVDDKTLFECTDNISGYGDVGVFVTNDVAVEFDDFSVKPVESNFIRLNQVLGPDIFSVSYFPNPFIKSINFALKKRNNSASNLSFQIYDLSGRTVYSKNITTTLHNSIIWTGYDNKGNLVSPGMYIAYFTNDNRDILEPVIFVKR